MVGGGAEREGGRRFCAAGFDVESEGASFPWFRGNTNCSCLTFREALAEKETEALKERVSINGSG